jgi:hypothetical protein
VIAGLRAEVATDGRIEVEGKAPLLGGGNGIEATARARVFAAVDAAG